MNPRLSNDQIDEVLEIGGTIGDYGRALANAGGDQMAKWILDYLESLDETYAETRGARMFLHTARLLLRRKLKSHGVEVKE